MRFNFKKKYGQNFLQNKQIITNIVNSINPLSNDLVIEIGPGSGALTKKLKEKGCNILCYEIDNEVEQFLNSLESDKLKIIYDDFLKRDIKNDIINITYNNLYIIGNLPYYITTPIINKIIESKINVKEMVFMVQKEVADRFSAQVGSKEYGSITVFLNYYFDIKKLFIVSKNNFMPKPNVDSAVIKFVSKDIKLDVDIDKFISLVKKSFQFKRKNLKNNLKDYDSSKLNNILSNYQLSVEDRAEEMSYEVFVDITNNYK